MVYPHPLVFRVALSKLSFLKIEVRGGRFGNVGARIPDSHKSESGLMCSITSSGGVMIFLRESYCAVEIGIRKQYNVIKITA